MSSDTVENPVCDADAQMKLGTELADAVRSGNTSDVSVALQKGAPVNVKAAGESALSIACSLGHADIVRVLVEAKADLNAANDDGSTALWNSVASESFNEEIVKHLLEAKADPNSGSTHVHAETTSLTEVISRGRGLSTTLLLLSHNADPNASVTLSPAVPSAHAYRSVRPVRRSALGAALIADDDPAAIALLCAGADPNAPHCAHDTKSDTFGVSPLILASANGRVSIVSALLVRGADPNARDPTDLRTALHAAAIAGAADVVAALLAAGADPNVLMARGRFPHTDEDMRGYSPLFVATSMGETAVVRAFSQVAKRSRVLADLHSGGPRAPGSVRVPVGAEEWRGVPRSHMVRVPQGYLYAPEAAAAAAAADAADAAAAERAAAGEAAAEQGATGGAVVDAAVARGRTDAAPAYSFMPAPAPGSGEDGESEPTATPLAEAVSDGNVEIVGLLLQAGADPAQRCAEGQTLADRARALGHADIADTLDKAVQDAQKKAQEAVRESAPEQVQETSITAQEEAPEKAPGADDSDA
jgi:ankyrin repeat protein